MTTMKFKDLSLGLKILIGILIGFSFFSIVCLTVIRVNFGDTFDKFPNNKNIARWECYNVTYLTHELDVANNTFYLIEPIEVFLEHDNEIHIMNDKFYRVKEKEDCRVI